MGRHLDRLAAAGAAWKQPARGELARRIDDDAARLPVGLEPPVPTLEIIEGLGNRALIVATRVGQAHMPAHPPEKRLPEPVLQQTHLMADRRRTEAELVSRQAEVAEAGGGLEALQELERWHVAIASHMNFIPQREETNSFDQTWSFSSIYARSNKIP